MKNEYVAPVASTVEFEAVDVVAMSIFDLLTTWGRAIESVEYWKDIGTADSQSSTPNFYE